MRSEAGVDAVRVRVGTTVLRTEPDAVEDERAVADADLLADPMRLDARLAARRVEAGAACLVSRSREATAVRGRGERRRARLSAAARVDATTSADAARGVRARGLTLPGWRQRVRLGLARHPRQGEHETEDPRHATRIVAPIDPTSTLDLEDRAEERHAAPPLEHRSRLAGLAFAVALLATTSPSRANGRFPAAAQLVVDPEDPAHIVVQVTYGLVSSRDAGATWQWTCERALGSVEAFDPPVQAAKDGIVIAALLGGLARSSADGCTWSFVDPSPDRPFAVDVSVSRSDPDDVIVLTSDSLGDDRFATQVLRGTAAGSIAPVGDALPDDFIGATIDVAPSDPSRVYLTGFRVEGDAYVGTFGRSDDGGVTFDLAPIDGTDASSGPFLAAVDPFDADVLYVRTTGDGGRILRSSDGGATWEPIFQGTGTLLGFALSPDGEQIVVGGERDAVHRGPAAGGEIVQVSELYPRCLGWFEGTVYACASEANDGFTVGRSLDEGETFELLYSRFCTEGPLDCGVDTSVGALCDEDWEILRTSIYADACFGTGGGAEGGGGATSSATGATGSGGGPDVTEDPTTPSSGCCAVAGGPQSRGSRVAILLFTVGAVVTASRRRGRRPGS